MNETKLHLRCLFKTNNWYKLGFVTLMVFVFVIFTFFDDHSQILKLCLLIGFIYFEVFLWIYYIYLREICGQKCSILIKENLHRCKN